LQNEKCKLQIGGRERQRICAAIVALAASLPSPGAGAGDIRLEVFPPQFRLDGPRARMQLVVTGVAADGSMRDLTREARFASSDERVVRVVGSAALPAGDGKATIISLHGDLKAESQVEVSSFHAPQPISLESEVLPVLTKHGCSTGACHGSPSGKGGFRLSLRGFDPELDQATLIREALGRRTNPLEPEKSLILRKPTMDVAHGGGKRLRSDDPGYAILKTWIGEGLRPDPAGHAACVALEAHPPRRKIKLPDRHQQLLARARFSDGASRDVTLLSDFSSTDEQVLTVSRDGLVEAKSRGEAAVLVRYAQQMAVVPFTVLEDVPGFVWPDPPENNYVDRLVFAKLRELRIPPSELCTDGEFVRRVYLDVIGTLPTEEETLAFLADTDPQKRAKLIDQLVERPEYARFWALRWGDLLRAKASKLSTAGVHKLHRWLVESLRQNMPYDRFARELVTAEGSTYQNPPAAFLRALPDPNTCAETASQIFLGIRIQCAKCHNHPYERWTQDHYYGIGAFFARVRMRESPLPGERFVVEGRQGEVTHLRTGKPARPLLPLAGPMELADDADRREVFAAWLTSPENPLFAKVAVNRIWGHLMGRGIVEPVDDFRESNPPSNAALLEALADDFQQHSYDQKHIIRTILTSRTYQLSSRASELNAKDEKLFSHSLARMLSAEQLLDAISRVTGSPERFPGLPAGTLATQLPSPDVGSAFLRLFGQPSRETPCECERGKDAKLPQALQLISGDFLTKKIRDPAGRLGSLFDDTRARLRAAGEPPRKDLVLWLRADAGPKNEQNANPRNGDAVAAWENQIGGGPSVAQQNPSLRPRFVASATGKLPAVRFDGLDDLLNNTQTNLVEAGSPRTVLIVGQAAKQGPGGSMFTFRRTRGDGASVFTCQHVLFGGAYYVYSDGVNGEGNSTLDSKTIKTVREPFVTAFVSAGVGQKLQVQLGGKAQSVGQPGAVGPDTGADGFTVGNREDYSPAGWNGEISEVLVYRRAMSSEELAAAGAYLACKYGLATDYPRIEVKPEAGDANGAEIIRRLYVSALCREPTDEETAALAKHIELVGDRRAALEDIFWAVLNSEEFLFQH
jgi:hypothetical protein